MSEFDINDIITQDEYESDEEFLVRKKITLKIANLEEYNPMTAQGIGRLIVNKVKLGVTYEPDVEKKLEKLMTYLS